jgi:uncharacterized lipoprotein
MKQSLKKISLIVIVLLAGCSSFRGNQSIIQNRDTDYLKAKSVPPLKIPPGMNSSTITAHYPVSDRAYPQGTAPMDLTPPGLNTPDK